MKKLHETANNNNFSYLKNESYYSYKKLFINFKKILVFLKRMRKA